MIFSHVFDIWGIADRRCFVRNLRGQVGQSYLSHAVTLINLQMYFFPSLLLVKHIQGKLSKLSISLYFQFLLRFLSRFFGKKILPMFLFQLSVSHGRALSSTKPLYRQTFTLYFVGVRRARINTACIKGHGMILSDLPFGAS